MKLAIIVTCLLTVCAFADDEQDAYCKYVTEQAAAERDRLRTPSFVSGFSQPSAALPMQGIWGLSGSVGNIRKSALTMQSARENCRVYQASTEAQMRLQYALPYLETAVLRRRLQLIEQATTQLEKLIAANNQIVTAQNATRPAIYPLQTAKLRLTSARATTSLELSATYVPPLTAMPLRELVASKLDRDLQSQKANARLERQNDWDLALSVGVHHQLHPWDQVRGAAFGEVTFTYNLGDAAVTRHLNHAAEAYHRWKGVQQQDIAHASEVLRQQIAETVRTLQPQLEILQAEDSRLAEELSLLTGIDTNAGIAFRNQLIADQMILRVDLGEMAFRLDTLRAFLHENF